MCCKILLSPFFRRGSIEMDELCQPWGWIEELCLFFIFSSCCLQNRINILEEERCKEIWDLCVCCLKLVTGIGLAVVIHTQTWTLLYISVFFIEAVSPSEMEAAALPNSSVNVGRKGKTLNIGWTQVMFILLETQVSKSSC